MMIVLTDMVMRELMRRIVETTHSLVDTAGEPVHLSTIDEPRLRMAAITAIQVATGEPVWPGDRKLVVKRPKAAFGIFEVEQ